MKPKDYEALLAELRATPEEIAGRREAERLAEIARNLEKLRELAEAEAEEEARRRAGG